MYSASEGLRHLLQVAFHGWVSGLVVPQDLADDQLRITEGRNSGHPELNDKLQSSDQGLVLRSIVGNREFKAECIFCNIAVGARQDETSPASTCRKRSINMQSPGRTFILFGVLELRLRVIREGTLHQEVSEGLHLDRGSRNIGDIEFS